MVAAVEIRAADALEAIEPSIDATTRLLQERLNALSPDEVAAVVEAVARALEPGDEAPGIVRDLMGPYQPTPAERVEAEVDVLMRSFQRRCDLLDGALTTAQVARLLGASRQTPHDRVASGTLLAVMDRGALRFPAWQFDPNGADGVVAGLPQAIRALDVSALAKVSWLTRANAMPDGMTPLAALKAGRDGEVVELARGVGVD